jgi:hypothetical protein
MPLTVTAYGSHGQAALRGDAKLPDDDGGTGKQGVPYRPRKPNV